MNSFWLSALEHPGNFILVFIVVLSGIFLFIYALHEIFPHPVKSVIDLVKVLCEEFNPKKTKNPVQIINALGAVVFAVLLFIILIGYLSHSLLNMVININEETSSQLMTIFIIVLFLFVFILTSSLILINKSVKEAALKAKAKKFDI